MGLGLLGAFGGSFNGVIMICTVAEVELSVPSFAWYVNESVPT